MKASRNAVHSQTESGTDALGRLHVRRLSLCKRLGRALADSSESRRQHLRHGEIRVWTSSTGHLQARRDTYTDRLSVTWFGRTVLEVEPGRRPRFDFEAAWARELYRCAFRVVDEAWYLEEIRAKRRAAAWLISTSEHATVLFTKRTDGSARSMEARCSERELDASGGLTGCERTGLLRVYDEDKRAYRQVNLDGVRSVETPDGAVVLFGATGPGKAVLPATREREAA